MQTKYTFLIALALCAFLSFGCSGGGGNVPTAPVEGSLEADSVTIDPHSCWGMWQFVCDPAAGIVDVVELRGADLHLNALRFLEPPVNIYLTLESAPVFSGGVLDVDIGLRHPFLGLNKFTGFDVCGVLISHGSVTGFASDPSIRMPGEGDTRLLNADGYTRWWNPTEFPHNAAKPIAGYIDGLLGTPHGTANFDATINGYKYFTDTLGPNDPLTMVDLDTRGMFSAGQKNIRHYTIDLGGAFVFNYAIDANWKYPVGDPPYLVPDDFSAAANRPEAWNINTYEAVNTLAYEEGIPSGTMILDILVYDWYDVELNEITVESPGNIAPVVTSAPVGGGEGYSTYQVEISSDSLTESGEIDLLITVCSESYGYQGLLPGKDVCAYFVHPTEISDITIVSKYKWVLDDEQIITDTDNFDRDPTINQISTYEIDIGYLRLVVTPGGTSATCQMLKSIDSGGEFTYQWKANSSHGGQMLDDLRVSTDPYGNSVFHYQSWLTSSMTISTHAAAVRNPQFVAGENQGLILCNSEKSNEITWTADEMLLSIADKDGTIRYKKGNGAGSCMYNHTWTGWENAPLVNLVDYPARLSETRSVVKDDSGAIHLAYYGGEDGVWIKMLSNSDGLGTDWDGDVYITEGLTDEFSSRIEPSIVIGPDGEFHASFIGVLDPLHSILYSTSEDGSAWVGYMPILSNTDGPLAEVTIDAFYHVDTTVIVISFEMDGDIWILYSLDGGGAFDGPVMISDGTGNSLEPDIRADSEGYVHIAWAQFAQENGMWDDYDIHYRRAYLVEED